MTDPGRLQILNHRRREKLRRVLIAQLGIEVT